MDEKTIVISIHEDVFEEVSEKVVNAVQELYPDYRVLPAVIKRPHA